MVPPLFALLSFLTAFADLERLPPVARVPLGGTPGYRRAITLDLAGRYAEALALYEAEARGPRGARSRYHAELSRGILERLDQVRRFPQDGPAHFSLGVDAANKVTALLRETGRVAPSLFSLAERALHEAERLLPKSADPIICLAGLYADVGRRQAARAAIARIEGKVLQPGELYNLACYHHFMGENEKAMTILERVMNDYYREWILRSDDFWRMRGDPRLERLLRGRDAERTR
jgi:tetratricopeptide (TPR) repeat protein